MLKMQFRAACRVRYVLNVRLNRPLSSTPAMLTEFKDLSAVSLEPP